MNRSDGLIQRRNVIKENDNNVSKSNSDDEEPKDNVGANGGDEDQDSKETRLTLMEEVLLLGLKDKEVCRLCKNHGPMWHFYHCDNSYCYHVLC
jgi:Golgi phosphoprotein 3 (GPP34).